MTRMQDVGLSICGLCFINLKFLAKGHGSPYRGRCEVRNVPGELKRQYEGLVE